MVYALDAYTIYSTGILLIGILSHLNLVEVIAGLCDLPDFVILVFISLWAILISGKLN